jgi:hypothetical protein
MIKNNNLDYIRIRNSTLAFVKRRVNKIRVARVKELREKMPDDYPMKSFRIRLNELNSFYDLIIRDIEKEFKEVSPK